MRRDVYQAIADPNRREIINLLATSKSLTLNEVSEKFNVSRPAISRHVRILKECGLIYIRQEGRERYCELRLQQLKQVSDWLNQYREFWTRKLEALGEFLEKEDRESKRKIKPHHKNIKTKTK